jgi:hypothetical protein
LELITIIMLKICQFVTKIVISQFQKIGKDLIKDVLKIFLTQFDQS